MKKIYTITLSILTLFANAQMADKNSKPIETSYKRSSLYTLMITDPSRNYEEYIKDYFTNRLLPDKYNNHNLENRYINSSHQKNELDNITAYLKENKVANKLVAKWYNRSSKGGFDTNLIAERGNYDAKAIDVAAAKSSARGMAMLGDAGEALINNTFVLVNNSKYTNKEEVASSAKSLLGAITKNVGVSVGSELTNLTLDTFGKGFVVATNSYLFKLVWNQETQNRFYTELYATDQEITPEKKAAFDNADFFELEYIGTDKSYADIQSTNLTSKTNGELIGRATIKSIDNVISKLQSEYDVFKTKTPIYSIDPIVAKVGLKDGVTSKTKFEILEQQMLENGSVVLVKVGTLKVDTKYPIWDNRYGADEENPNQESNGTIFKVTSGKDFAPGQLIRQIR